MDDILIEELELGVRSYNCLKRAGIQTVGDLISKSEGELAAIPNFGKKSIDEVVETLSQRGLNLRTDWTMRHQKTRHKLSRDASHRKALLANLCVEVIDHERIKTTEAKAKAVKPELEKLITLAKKGDLHARRQAIVDAPAPRQGRDLQAVRRDRAALHGPPRRLHAHPQARPASR